MNQIIKEVKDLDMKKIIEPEFNKYKEAFTRNVKAYINLCEKQGKSIDMIEKEQALSISDETLLRVADNVHKNLVLQGVIQALNTMLNILVAPHFEFLRYPDLKNPLEYYIKENPLIKRLKDLIIIQKDNISFHKEYFEILERAYSNIQIE